MRHINKTVPPEEFIDYCKTPGVSYEGLSGEPKRKLRRRLIEDQGYICCYCGMEIFDDEHTKIEHVQCQKNIPILSYVLIICLLLVTVEIVTERPTGRPKIHIKR